mgnify:CR=1 FL=1
MLFARIALMRAQTQMPAVMEQQVQFIMQYQHAHAPP